MQRLLILYLLPYLLSAPGCHDLPRANAIDAHVYAASARPQLAGMSAPIKIVPLGMRGYGGYGGRIAPNVDHLVLDFLIDGPYPDAMHAGTVIADSIATAPHLYLKIHVKHDGAQELLEVSPVKDLRSHTLRALSHSNSTFQGIVSCGVKMSQVLRTNRAYRVELIGVPGVSQRLVDPDLRIEVYPLVLDGTIQLFDLTGRGLPPAPHATPASNTECTK